MNTRNNRGVQQAQKGLHGRQDKGPSLKAQIESLRNLVIGQGRTIELLEDRVRSLEHSPEDTRAQEMAERRERFERAETDRKLRELENDLDDLRRRK